jgi:phosphoribosylanthranilate isomerase
MTIAMKFCGLTRPEDVSAAVAAGAAYMGLVFFAKSPRYVSPETARDLAMLAPPGLVKVALTVDADDAMLDALLDTVPIDMLQLHGRRKPRTRGEVRARTGLPVMKAIGIAGAEDLAQIDAYSGVADQLLIDAKPPKDATLPGWQRAQLRLAPSGGAEILDEAVDAGRWADARTTWPRRCA